MEPTRWRPIRDVLGTGALTGAFAGLAVGAIDAVWSWAPAAQFVPHLSARLRFVAYVALSHAACGLAIGALAALVLVALSRATRLGDLLRFAFADHRERRAKDPRVTVVGLSVVLAGVPTVVATLWIAYRAIVPFVANRHVVWPVVVVAMAAALAAVAIAVPIAFLLARAIEFGLAALAPRVRAVSSVWAPFVALGALAAASLLAWASRDWDTAKLVGARAPIVVALGALLAIPLHERARRTVERAARLRAWIRRAAWSAAIVVLALVTLVAGSSPQVVKATIAYTGLGGPLSRSLRVAIDFDRDGYSPILGGGDCDDFDARVHPGVPEIPDDGIDQNCIGGDAHYEPPKPPEFYPVPAGVPKDFNVLLVTIDTTRADHLGAYGYARDTSPNLDRLAKSGTLFVNGWAHAPSTRYSMPAILTGRLPLDVYYENAPGGWPGVSATKGVALADELKKLGFKTGAFTNYEYFERYRHFDRGFDEYDNANAALHVQTGPEGPAHTRGSSSKQQTDKALAFVAAHEKERWFLWVHYYDPHYEYERHAEKSFGDTPIDLYDGEIYFTDLHIGRLLDDLRARGLYDKTVVVVTGDHGEGFGEHGVSLHGYHLYAAQTKVPFIVRVPGIAPRRATTPAGHVDIVPTLVNLAGGAPSPEMMGRSLVPILTGPDDDARVVFQQLSYEGNHEMRAGAGATCHVIYNISPDTSWEIYDVAGDPLETEDLADDSGACRATRDSFERWYDRSTVPPGAAEALLHSRPPIARPLDVDFGDAVRLLAVDAPTQVKTAATAVDVTWTFEARGETPPGWKLFVHAESPNKQMANSDHAPPRAFEWWNAGDVIRYTTSVALPRGGPGRYTIWVGMFRGNARAPVTSPHLRVDNDAVAAATIEVVQ
jgi:arylsulfatase A-like enzyme